MKTAKKTVQSKFTGPVFLVLGGLFGFLLSRAGATTYDFYAQLFLFQNFQLVWVIGVAAGLGAVVNTLARRKHSTKPMASILTQETLDFTGKPYTKTLVPGSVIFGLGWGLAGACPGTALAMLGEGKLGSILTITGFFIGTYLYGVQESGKMKRSPSST